MAKFALEAHALGNRECRDDAPFDLLARLFGASHARRYSRRDHEKGMNPLEGGSAASGLLAAMRWNWLSPFRTPFSFHLSRAETCTGLWLHYSASERKSSCVSVFIFKMTQFGAFSRNSVLLHPRRDDMITCFSSTYYTGEPGWDRTSDHRFRRLGVPRRGLTEKVQGKCKADFSSAFRFLTTYLQSTGCLAWIRTMTK